jgi:hypothetical protein
MEGRRTAVRAAGAVGLWGAKTLFRPPDHSDLQRNRVLTPQKDDAEKLKG